MKLFSITQTLALLQRFSRNSSKQPMKTRFCTDNGSVSRQSKNIRPSIGLLLAERSDRVTVSKLVTQVTEITNGQIKDSESRLLEKLKFLEDQLSLRASLRNLLIDLLICFMIVSCVIYAYQTVDLKV